MESLNKLKVIDVFQLNKIETYIPIDSNAWRSPAKITVDNLIAVIQFEKIEIAKQIDNETIILDPVTLKIKVNNVQSLSGVEFIDQDISIYKEPTSYPAASGMQFSIDDNYLYIWHEKQKKWKRVPLLDLD